MSHQQEALNNQNNTLADSKRRVAEMSAKRKKAKDELSVLCAEIECGLAFRRGLKDVMGAGRAQTHP